MKNVKRLITIGAIVSMFGAVSVTSYAASSYNTPAEAVAGLTDQTVEAVTATKVETGKTYGTMANDAGKLEEFQSEILEIKKDMLNERVEKGLMTQERADAIISAIEENQSTCDGTGTLHTGQKMGAGFGSMKGNGIGQGQGNGQGMHGYGGCTELCQQQ